MGSNLPPGVTHADIDRHFGPPDHDHEFEEPWIVEADETLIVTQKCVHGGGSPRDLSECDAKQVTYYKPDRIEIVDNEGDVVLVVQFPRGLDHVCWADDLFMNAERAINDGPVDPVAFDPCQDEIGFWVDECSLNCNANHRIAYRKYDQEVIV